MRRIVFVMLSLATVGIGAAVWKYQPSSASSSPFRTADVERGDLRVAVSATGTTQPEEVVDVGAQVAGRIVEFGKDLDDSAKHIDYGSAIKAGTVLARIDDSIYASQVRQSQAQAAQALAAVSRAEADRAQVRTQLRQVEREWTRATKLRSTNAISDSEMEKAEASYETSKSALAVAEAAVIQAQRGADFAKAVLAAADANLGYTTISSPIDGVIIDRRVNIGQTVVSSLNAPSLFLIAKDLRRMQVWALVNEADIGRIYKGQAVDFTVDAYPDQTFVGEVSQVRLNASMTQNVVTYTVVVSTDNSDGKLLPYLTANAQFAVEVRKNVLMVPNSALRWRPTEEQVVPDERPGMADMLRKNPKGSGKRAAGKGAREGTLWVLDGVWVRPVRVRVGLGNDAMTEIESETLRPDSQIVVGEVPPPRRNAVKSPFTPQVNRDRKSDL